ncbi:MAG: OsmC family protein [Rhodoferax sp.]|nr:OsmC family protein [Rhodoferax sp.]
MGAQDIAAALQRVEAVFMRRPEAGLHDDAPVTARWNGGTRVVASHTNGTQVATDMPVEIGGTGDKVTPGWLFRAGLASCAATSIALLAAAEGIELATLEVRATSRSDARGLLGMVDDGGEMVFAGPRDMQLHVRVAAQGVSAERLRTLVETGLQRSPIPNAVSRVTPLSLQIDTTAA